MSSSPPGLRSLFEALAAHRSPTQMHLEELTGLARQVVGAEADDAVGSFLEVTCHGSRTGGSASAERFLALGDHELPKVVRHRLRQHAIRQRPLWALTKALRQHVAKAFEQGLPQPPLAPPPGLLQGDRLHSVLVGQAVAFFAASEPDLERTPAAIAKRLLEVYLVPQAHEHEPAGFDEDLRRHRDGLVLAADIREVLGPVLVRILRHRLAGLGFEAIAEQEGISVSTAHGRHQAALTRLKAFRRQVQNSYETERVALLYATSV